MKIRKIGRLENWNTGMVGLFHHSFIPSFLLFAALLSSCKKDEPTISTIPEITFESVSPSSVTEYADAITFTISYKDGDGNLGENNADATNLFLTDLRNSVVYKYRIQQLSPDGSSIAIQGKLNIVLNNIAILGSGTQESATFSIYLKDRAGNTSNMVTSTGVTVKK